jgi:hypothetical protein
MDAQNGPQLKTLPAELLGRIFSEMNDEER